MVHQSVQSYQATTANEQKHSIFDTVVFLAKYFCEYILLLFNKPVYSCKDTTGKSGDEDGIQHQEQMAVFRGAHKEQMAVLRDEHHEQNKQRQEQMTMLQEQLKTLQSSLNNPRENVPTPMASFQPLDSTSELWTDYLARFRTFVTANSIPDNKQAQIFLTNQSNSVYKMLSNLAAQQQPVKSIHELTMNDIQTFMAEQFDPKRFVVRTFQVLV